jgi:hypothetical protein
MQLQKTFWVTVLIKVKIKKNLLTFWVGSYWRGLKAKSAASMASNEQRATRGPASS